MSPDYLDLGSTRANAAEDTGAGIITLFFVDRLDKMLAGNKRISNANSFAQALSDIAIFTDATFSALEPSSHLSAAFIGKRAGSIDDCENSRARNRTRRVCGQLSSISSAMFYRPVTTEIPDAVNDNQLRWNILRASTQQFDLLGKRFSDKSVLFGEATAFYDTHRNGKRIVELSCCFLGTPLLIAASPNPDAESPRLCGLIRTGLLRTVHRSG
jgi:hypothetical protein